jgi:hypothetical protein
MTHHDPDAVIVPQSFGREIAEHPQMAMLTIDAIFRGVMRLESSHIFRAVLLGV